MIEYLDELDANALLAINGLNDAFQDMFWWMVSAKWASLLLLLALLWILLHQNRRHALLVLAMLVLAIVLADQISSGLIKQMVERLRPSHDPQLESMVRVINGYRGGMYGFVSSHAANSFAAVMLLSLIMRHRAVTISLLVWSLMQCYSRLYLGVHYPGDILGGMMVGAVVGWLLWRLMCWIQHRWHIPECFYTRSDALLLSVSLAITVVALLTASLIPLL